MNLEALRIYNRCMRMARKGKALWLVLSEDEGRAHGIALGDEVNFEPGEGKALMAITKRLRLIRRPEESSQK
jgi:hypothetical protein